MTSLIKCVSPYAPDLRRRQWPRGGFICPRAGHIYNGTASQGGICTTRAVGLCSEPKRRRPNGAAVGLVGNKKPRPVLGFATQRGPCGVIWRRGGFQEYQFLSLCVWPGREGAQALFINFHLCMALGLLAIGARSYHTRVGRRKTTWHATFQKSLNFRSMCTRKLTGYIKGRYCRWSITPAASAPRLSIRLANIMEPATA